jgi:hypothetical protein
MEVSNVLIIVGVVVLALLLLVARRLLRFAIRLVLVAFVLVALFGAIAFGWWNGWFERHRVESATPRSSPTRRVSSH